MKPLSSKYLWAPFFLGVALVAIVAFFVARPSLQKASLPKVSPTSPKEVNDAYEQEMRTLYESSKVVASCIIRIETITKEMQGLRVPKEKREVHLRAFLALSKLPKETPETACDEEVRIRLTSLLSSPL